MFCSLQHLLLLRYQIVAEAQSRQSGQGIQLQKQFLSSNSTLWMSDGYD